MEGFDSKNHSRITVLGTGEKNMRVKALGTVHNLVRGIGGAGWGWCLSQYMGEYGWGSQEKIISC